MATSTVPVATTTTDTQDLQVLGLMSGTSADGIDAALLSTDGRGPGVLRGHWFHPYPPELRDALLALQAHPEADAWGQMDRRLGRVYAAAATAVLADVPTPMDAIALHGQTLRHLPDGPLGFTVQLGSAAELALATGCTVVHDFRRADVAAGGQGAPLVPPYHACRYQGPEALWVLNLGGMANITWIPPLGSAVPLQAFDTGPANVLIDGAVRLLSDGRQQQDEDGAWAAQGQVHPHRLATWLAHPFFLRPPPKSTGREVFGDALVQSWWQDWPGSAADFLATLTALTAESVARAARAWTPGATTLRVFGGGARNPTLLAALGAALPGASIHAGDADAAMPVQALEAAAFAWLGDLCLRGRTLDLGQVTGQRHRVVLGNILPGQNWGQLLSRLQAGRPA